MLKFYRFLILPLTAVFLASTAGIARYAADSCTQARMYRQLAALTENFPGDAASLGNNFFAAVSGAVRAKQRPCRVDTD